MQSDKYFAQANVI